MKDEGTPFSKVFDNSLERIRVMKIPSKITPVSKNAERRVPVNPLMLPIKNIVIKEIRVGNLPLQGTKLLVRIAISRSLGESMIRQPMTPAALQPNPIHIHRLCLPHAHAL